MHFRAAFQEFLIGARPSPNFTGLLRITSFLVHPKKPILGPSLWLYCAILTILREIDLHFAARPPSRPTEAQDEDFDQEPELAASTAIWRPDQSLEAAQMVDFIDFGLAGAALARVCSDLAAFTALFV